MEDLLGIDHILRSLKVGTEGHKKGMEGLIPAFQEFYNAFGAWTHVQNSVWVAV